MPELVLSDVPDDLYRRIEQLAATDRLPVPEATLRLLREAVGRMPSEGGSADPTTPARTQREILDEIIRNRITPAPGTPDSVEMLREDRNR